jgi:hypothetical protein
MAEFYEKIMKWNEIKPIGFGWNTVANPTFMNPEILGHYAGSFFDELLSTIPNDEHRKRYLEGFKTQVTTHPVDPTRLKRLYNYLNKIDERRGTDWKSLYPWLVEICEKETVKNI